MSLDLIDQLFILWYRERPFKRPDHLFNLFVVGCSRIIVVKSILNVFFFQAEDGIRDEGRIIAVSVAPASFYNRYMGVKTEILPSPPPVKKKQAVVKPIKKK